MVFHIMSVLRIGLGTGIVVLSVMLWSRFQKFTSGVLAITGLLLYASLLVEVLSHYRLFNIEKFLTYKGMPVITWILSVLFLVSFIFTLIVFMKEERR
jgi:hypothetical protein